MLVTDAPDEIPDDKGIESEASVETAVGAASETEVVPDDHWAKSFQAEQHESEMRT